MEPQCYDDTLTFIANELDPNKDSLERIGINRAREIIEQGGPELQSYVTELASRKLQEMRMPNHYMMESRYDALSNHASASAATIDSALQEKMENNIGLGNMANDFGYLEEQGKNKLSGGYIQKTRDDLADRATGIVESKIDSIGKTGHALKEEVNKAEGERMLKKYIGRETKNDGSWSG